MTRASRPILMPKGRSRGPESDSKNGIGFTVYGWMVKRRMMTAGR